MKATNSSKVCQETDVLSITNKVCYKASFGGFSLLGVYWAPLDWAIYEKNHLPKTKPIVKIFNFYNEVKRAQSSRQLREEKHKPEEDPRRVKTCSES